MDIVDRLERLENLVRHDDEARMTCSDARREILRLRGVQAVSSGQNQVNAGWWKVTMVDVGDGNVDPKVVLVPWTQVMPLPYKPVGDIELDGPKVGGVR